MVATISIDFATIAAKEYQQQYKMSNGMQCNHYHKLVTHHLATKRGQKYHTHSH